MNTIYQETVRAVDNGAKFKIDFRRRSLKINGTYIIRDGKCDRELGIPPSTENEFFAKMEELYLLCQILGGFRWNPETMGHWFWQSRTDRDLVILREWVEPDNNH